MTKIKIIKKDNNIGLVYKWMGNHNGGIRASRSDWQSHFTHIQLTVYLFLQLLQLTCGLCNGRMPTYLQASAICAERSEIEIIMSNESIDKVNENSCEFVVWIILWIFYIFDWYRSRRKSRSTTDTWRQGFVSDWRLGEDLTSSFAHAHCDSFHMFVRYINLNMLGLSIEAIHAYHTYKKTWTTTITQRLCYFATVTFHKTRTQTHTHIHHDEMVVAMHEQKEWRSSIKYSLFLTVYASLTWLPLAWPFVCPLAWPLVCPLAWPLLCLCKPTLLNVVVLPARDRQPPSLVPFSGCLPSVPYTLPPPFVSNCRAYELSAYAWKQHLTSALAAASRLQMNTWHSSTLMPVVRRSMDANMGGCWARGARANGESSGRNFGSGCVLPRSGINTWRTAAQ